jgi:hypothetical protein
MDEERPEVEDWEEALEVIYEDLRFFKRLRGQRRFGNFGMGRSEVDVDVDTNDEVSRLPRSRASSFDNLESRVIFSPSASRANVSSLYSVNTASTLVPGLIALSMGLAPVTPSDSPPAVVNSNNQGTNAVNGG